MIIYLFLKGMRRRKSRVLQRWRQLVGPLPHPCRVPVPFPTVSLLAHLPLTPPPSLSRCCLSATLRKTGWKEGVPLGFADLRLGTVYQLPSDSLTWHGSLQVTISPLPCYDSPVVIAPLAMFPSVNASMRFEGQPWA